MTEIADAAIEYAEMGLAVFPLEERQKSPATKHGFKDATKDARVIRSVWSDYPECNIGIATGAASGGIFAIDLDVDSDRGFDSTDWLAEWEHANGKLPETACETTGRGGVHLFYRADREVRCSSNDDLHIDVRGDGGYVMVAPSVHPNGNSVYWDRTIGEFGIADADDLVYRLVEEVRPKSDSLVEQFELPEDGDVVHGARDRTIFRFCCSMRAKNVPDDVIAVAARSFNSMHCKPPLSDDEVMRKVASSLKYKPGTSDENGKKKMDSSRDRVKPRAKFDHSAIGDALIRDNGACNIDGMPAIDVGDHYDIGFDSIDREIIGLYREATISQQREVHHYLKVMAPTRERTKPSLIAFRNGVLDIETLELLERTRDMVITNVIPHDWNPGASCDAVWETLKNVSNDDTGMLENLSEVMGLCMYGSSAYGYAPILLGEGANGKSTYMAMLEALVGSENISALQPNEIGMRFQARQLMGNLANIGDDISGDFLDSDTCSVIKKVATGNTIYTDVKNGDGINFRPYATLVFSANKMPRLGDNTLGMRRRLFPLSFSATFRPGTKGYDPHLVEKVTTEDACEFMAFMGVIGLSRVLKNASMTPNDESERMLVSIEVENSTVLQWIDSNMYDAEWVEGQTPQSVYDDYNNWCKNNGMKPVSSRLLGNEIVARWHVKSMPDGHETRNGKRITVRHYRKM